MHYKLTRKTNLLKTTKHHSYNLLYGTQKMFRIVVIKFGHVQEKHKGNNMACLLYKHLSIIFKNKVLKAISHNKVFSCTEFGYLLL